MFLRVGTQGGVQSRKKASFFGDFPFFSGQTLLKKILIFQSREGTNSPFPPPSPLFLSPHGGVLPPDKNTNAVSLAGFISFFFPFGRSIPHSPRNPFFLVVVEGLRSALEI